MVAVLTEAWMGMPLPLALWAAMWLVTAAIRGSTAIRVSTTIPVSMAIPVSAPTPSDAEQVALMSKVKRPAVLASATAARSCP